MLFVFVDFFICKNLRPLRSENILVSLNNCDLKNVSK